MIRLTNLADYAVVVMVQAAQAADGRVNASVAAQSTALPAPTVAKIMGTLSRAGLLVSTRGVGGGFRLARPALEISVADIIEAVDGPIAITQCVDRTSSPTAGDDTCSVSSVCCMRQPWQIINQSIRDSLDRISLDELARRTFSFPEPPPVQQVGV